MLLFHELNSFPILRQALGIAQCFKKLITREVTSMHSVHVTLFDALFYRFTRYQPSEKSLHPDDGFDVCLEHMLHFLTNV